MPFGSVLVVLLAAGQADLILEQARIYTVDASRPWAEAVAIKDGRITVYGAIQEFCEDGVIFTDGRRAQFHAVVLATGYQPRVNAFLTGIAAAAYDANGTPLSSGRESSMPGLYFCGYHVSPTGMLREIAMEALAHVGMEGHKDTALGHLSGGQQQRVFIARALAQQPHVLLLDEPTTGLDITTQHNVIELIEHLHQELGLTVVLVTHDINMIRERVDRLILLKIRLYAAGPPDDVLKADILRDVYGKDLVITDKDLIIVEDYHHHH